MSDGTTPGSEGDLQHKSAENERRREFLKSLGKAALITPPAMTILLSTSLESEAIAASGGRSPPGKTKKKGDFINRIPKQAKERIGFLLRRLFG